MTERKALKLALEVLKKSKSDNLAKDVERRKAIAAAEEALAQPEPVAWPCVIAEADFSENTITLTMQCTDYKVSAGKHWLSTTTPQRTWVGLTPEEVDSLANLKVDGAYLSVPDTIRQAEAKLKEKNT